MTKYTTFLSLLTLAASSDTTVQAFVAQEHHSVSSAPDRSTVALSLKSKNNNNVLDNNKRTHLEYSFEESMGITNEDNWRLFRSRLIEQQQHTKKKVTLQEVVENHDPYAIMELDLTSSAAAATETESSSTLNKNQWVHLLTHVEQGCVLVSKSDNVAEQLVVLIIEHDEQRGTKGIIINKPYKASISELDDHSLDISLKLAFAQSPVAFGGPMATEDYTILHGNNYGSSNEVTQGVFVDEIGRNSHRRGSNLSEIKKAARRQKRSNVPEALFVKGHIAWSPTQLYQQVQEDGKWTIAATSSDFLLRHVYNDDEEHLWSDIMDNI